MNEFQGLRRKENTRECRRQRRVDVSVWLGSHSLEDHQTLQTK